MKKNKMLSLAAAMVLTTTSAMAFEADYNGQIYTMNGTTKVLSGYNSTVGVNAVAPAVLTASPSQNGDALIYPSFSAKSGWETEIKVRNTTNDGIVAKVVLYAKNDSRELRDFNIYLSQKDVFSFMIADGKLTTRDGSFAKSVKFPDNTPTTSKDAVNMVDHENETVTITTLTDEESEGYVVIYGMAQVPGYTYHTTGSDEGHQNLLRDYRKNLDNCRPGWGAAFVAGGMVNGMITQAVAGGVNSPNVLDTCNNAAVVAATDLFATNTAGKAVAAAAGAADAAVQAFTTVNATALSGSVRLSQANGTDSRDMVLPATALTNFTDDVAPAMMLWTEGEYASIGDRNIVAVAPVAPATATARYADAAAAAAAGVGPIESDATSAFGTAATTYTYTYKEGSLKNQLLFTQPMKRILVQLGDGARVYTGETYSTVAATLGNTTNYGYFTTATTVYNENEDTTVIAGVQQAIISPFNASGVTVTQYKDEVAVIDDIENLAASADNAALFTKSGIAEVVASCPAIVTQMSGSVAVDGDAQVNWVQAPSK